MSTDKLLSDNLYANLATVCEDGSPWNTPLFYAHDGNKIYWWSPVNAVHSRNLFRDPRAFITIYDSRVPEGEGVGVYFEGVAREVVAENVDKVISIYCRKARVFKLSSKDCTGNAPTRLYEFKIKKSWTNDEAKENGMYIDVRKDSD